MVGLTREPIRVDQVLAAVSAPGAGAVVTFDGRVRDHSEGRQVRRLYYEAYEPMALAEIEAICRDARQRWPLQGLAVIHRLGVLEVGDSSIFIAVASAHRADGFAACRFVIDRIKETVPIWKKEYWDDGSAWVEGQDTGAERGRPHPDSQEPR